MKFFRRIINRKSTTIEFKESYGHAGMAQYFKTIATFANNAGGYIIFGVIYTYSLSRKPCICKKVYEAQTPKYTLREGDILYRYGGRSERIYYEELLVIVERERQAEERQWVEFVKRAAKIGIENACLLDLKSGVVSGKGTSLIIDCELLSKISFIKKGNLLRKKEDLHYD